jgi:hypothetical protein
MIPFISNPQYDKLNDGEELTGKGLGLGEGCD